METSKVVTVKDEIAYENKGVVSKTLVEKKTGTVTLFAFDKGQGLSEHSAPFDAMVQVVEGKGQFTIGKDKVIVSGGELVIMPADIPHAVFAVEKFKMLLTMIRS